MEVDALDAASDLELGSGCFCLVNGFLNGPVDGALNGSCG